MFKILEPCFVFQQSEIEQIEKSERVGGAQQHKRVTAALNKQIQQQSSRIEEVCIDHHSYYHMNF